LGRGDGALAGVLRAFSRGAGSVVGLAFATNAIIALLTILPARTPVLVAELFESTGGGAEGVRRSLHGVGEAAFTTVLAHVPLGLRSPRKIEHKFGRK
jgi:hypothetical protein